MKLILVLYSILLSSLLIFTKPREGSKCKTLAFEGGGTKGIYQVGALEAFYDLLSPDDYEYDFVSGVSVGSLHTLAYMLVKKGNESFLIDYLKKKYENLKASQMFQNWPGGIVAGILFHSGLVDNTPLIEDLLIQSKDELYTGDIYRRGGMSATDAGEDVETPFSDEINISSMIPIAKNSFSIPGAFEYSVYEDHIYIDGGCLYNVDYLTPISYCKEMGYEDQDIIIDVMGTNPFNSSFKDMRNASSIEMFNRAREFSNREAYYYYYHDTRYFYKDINFRYSVIPKKSIDLNILWAFPLSTNKRKMENARKDGYNDAKEEIENSKLISFVK